MSTNQPVRPVIRTRRRNREGQNIATPTTPNVYELEERSNGGITPAPTNSNPEQTGAKPYKSLRERGLEGFKATCTFSFIKPEERLGYIATSFMIINRVVGTGIFDIPPTLLIVVGSKGAGMIAWLFGCLITWAGLTVYIEYGIRFPLSGGELYYIDFIWTRPAALATYVYGIMFIILGGCQGNALAFGSAIQIATNPDSPKVDYTLQKILAVGLVAIACLVQAYSRNFNFFLSNIIGLYKILLLAAVTVIGWAALGGARTSAAESEYGTPYGKDNFIDSFNGTRASVYSWGIAGLLTQRAFLGFEYANQVLEEIKRPRGDEFVIFRNSLKFSMGLICFFYIMVQLAYYATCTADEIKNTTDIMGLFFQKVFGPSRSGHRASGTIKSIFAIGNVVAFSYSSVKVQQEIARIGILPYSEFWARSTHGGTPGPALLLQFIFTTLIIICTPLSNANGYLVMSTLFAWTRSWVGVLLGMGLLFAWKLRPFKKGDEAWTPVSMPRLKGPFRWAVVMTLCVIYTLANLAILILGWIPADSKKELGTTRPVLASFMGPAVGTAICTLGGLYWIWNRYILPALGYRMSIEAERGDGFNVHLTYTRYVSGFSIKVLETLELLLQLFHRLINSIKGPFQNKEFAENEPSFAYHTLGGSRGQRIGWG